MAADGIGSGSTARARLHSRAWLAALLPALLLLLACVLGAAAYWSKQRGDEALRQKAASDALRLDAVMTLVATQQAGGHYAAAAALAASEPALPAAFKENARLARYETATLLDGARLPLGRAPDIDWLQAAAGTRPVLVAWGWSSGVGTIEVGAGAAITNCGLLPGAPRISLAADGRWFSVLNLPTHELALLVAPACTQEDKLLAGWSAYVARQEGRGAHVSAVLPLPGPQLLLGWADGRVELLRGSATPLPIMRFDSAAVGLIANSTASAFALLSRSGRLELVDPVGRGLAAPLQLKRDVLASTRDEPWVSFVRDAAAPAAHALLLEQAALDTRAPAALGLLSNPESAAIYLHDLPDAAPRVFDVAVARSPADGCPHLRLLGADRLSSYAMDPRCGNPAARDDAAIALPAGWSSSSEADRGYAAGAFCDGGATLVLGGWHGELLWMRPVHPAGGSAPARVDVEHVERTAWDDPVSALACREDGSVHAGFQSAGIKAFRPRLHLQERIVGIRSIKDYAEVLAEDQSWSVEAAKGPARLEFQAESGELGLLEQGHLVWRRKLAEPAPTRPGPSLDKVNAVLADAPRGRVWVLTTLGRLTLLELNTGTVLLRASTTFFAAAPSKDVAMERPKLDGGGQLSFVHRFRDTAMRVTVVEGTP